MSFKYISSSPINTIERLWKRMKQGIVLMGDEEIYLKDSPNVRIPYIEQWGEIVANA